MSGFTSEHNDAISAACRDNAAAIAQSLSQCFDQTFQIEVGESRAWNPEEVLQGFDSAGLRLCFNVGDQAVFCLIPESLPLPEWYIEPGDSERSRLNTLAMEWSLNMLPGDLDAGKLESRAVGDLAEEVRRAAPSEQSMVLELLVKPAGSPASGESASAAGEADQQESDSTTPGGEPAARLLVIWPVLPVAESEELPDDVPDLEAFVQSAGSLSPSTLDGLSADAKRRRLLSLPVTVVVQLAAKKIEMGQLLSLTPGALITFTKSCEDRLDLYVNNRLYCRGEAVKIGEKFGLKVSQVGVVEVRQPKIL